MRDIQEVIRPDIIQAVVSAAEANKLPIQADAVAVATQQELTVVNAPVAGLEEVDFKYMLERGPVLDNTPIMYWYLTGEALDDKAFPFSEGFYTVVADQQRGTVALRDAKGTTVAHGDLEISIEPPAPPTTTTARRIVQGGITSASATLWPPRVKVCGWVKVKQGGVTVKVSACVSAGF
jgi:hypothetical protein